MSNKITCAICFEHLTDTKLSSATQCGHIFHDSCIDQWLRRSHTCPECRRHITPDRLRLIYPHFFDYDESVAENATGPRDAEKRNLEIAVDKCNEKNGQLSSEIDMLTIDVTNAYNKISEQRVIIKNAETTINTLTKASTASEIAFRAMSEQLRQEREKNRTLELQFVSCDKVNQDLRTYNETLEAARNSLSTNWAQISEIFPDTNNPAELAKLIRDMKNDYSICIARCSALQEFLTTSNERLSKEREEKGRLLNELASQDGVKDRLVKRNAELEACQNSTEWKRVSAMFPGAKDSTELVNMISATISELTTTTARCSELQRSTAKYVRDLTAERMSNRKLKLELGKQTAINIADLQKRRAETQKSLPSTENFADQKTENGESKKKQTKRLPRQALATIDSNTETRSESTKTKYNLRPR